MTQASFPKIVCLCGSTRFMSAFREANMTETIAGNIVLSVGMSMKDTHPLWEEPEDHLALKARMDALHKQKIKLADEILVLNVGGYYGDSTASEIEYARSLGKKVRWLEAPIE